MEKQLADNDVWSLLSSIPDPEIPVINILELGVVRDAKVHNKEVDVVITPTYSGCPAMKQINDDIVNLLKQHGFEKVNVTTSYSPAWTTDWISDEGKRKLKEYGIAPPEKSSPDKSILGNHAKLIKCPRCGSADTEMKSFFGS
ncbi:MAG TPA: 1,2-phenylacetyl-CoA epoxidase subunit PaaD, partial [Nitrosopumilaceae archaeon]|nr:1,2-phenylacetyl-CoA epoxidase subunit PaaD [Nitrosopumilaceae archaeon]